MITLKQLIFLTGRPGVGKTSVLLRAINSLKAKEYTIGGMISREFRDHGVRVGFEIVDIKTGKKGWLAHVNQPNGPRVGKYRVNLHDLKTIGVYSILKAVEESDVVVVDEIGPMELFSCDFKEAVIRSIESKKPLIGTIHYRAHNPLINTIKADEDAEILEVTQNNRECLHSVLIDRVLQFIRSRSSCFSG